MSRSIASPLTAPAIVVAIILVLRGAGATVETTCKAAAECDKQVNVEFCVQELSKHNGSRGADDAWGLAKVAAAVGAISSGTALADMGALQTKPGLDDNTMGLLVMCEVSYTDAEYNFNRARDDIDRRSYAEAKEAVGLSVELARGCDGEFAKAAIPSPFTLRSWYTEQIATICTAITSLIG